VEEEVAVRRAELGDAAALLALQCEFYTSSEYPWDGEQKERAIRQLLAGESLGRLLVFERGGAIAGYMSLTFGFSLECAGRDAFVDELYVTPHARGAGIGTRALEAAEHVCRDAGILALHLEVEFENESAKRLYSRQGYHEHTRYLMTKVLQ
jgi:GNAT superfamily N-acetyltransferase